MAITVDYSLRDGGDELVNRHQPLRGFQDACRVIDDYPWADEIVKTEALGEGGGFFFLREEGEQYASFQLVPIDDDRAFLDVEVVQKKGLLGFIGRRAVSKDFDALSVEDAKRIIKELFDYPVDQLYRKYHGKG